MKFKKLITGLLVDLCRLPRSFASAIGGHSAMTGWGMTFQYVRKYGVKKAVTNWWTKPQDGSLSNKALFRLAAKNLRNQPSRTLMTVMAIAMGTAAVVFLVSFAYGLQEIVTKRLVSPNSMRMTDVISATTSLTLNDQTVSDVSKISGVAGVAPLVSLAGSLNFNDSRIDVVVLSVGENYYDYSQPVMVDGTWMAQESFAKFTGEADDLNNLIGQVAGWSNDIPEETVKIGSLVEEGSRRFLINDDEYLPLRDNASKKASVIGYVKGSVLHSFSGNIVWGSAYESVDSSGKAFRTQSGDWFGKWIKAEVPVYKEIASTIYEPITKEDGSQIKLEGYLTMNSVRVLNRTEEMVQKGVEQSAKEGEVLGDATSSAVTQISVENTDATVSAELVRVAIQETTDMATQSAELSVVEIKREGGKEAVVTSALLNTFKLKQEDVIGKTVTLEYILSGGQIPGSNGRVLTKPVTYTVVGIVKDDKKPMIYTPIQELQSVGVNKYSLLKVLAVSPGDLNGVREKIQTMGFTTQSIVDTLVQVDKLFRIMKFLLGAFGFTALIVALFGMFNTLTVSLLERTREVGVMKTLGTVDKDIFRLFMAESVLIGVTGGFAGVMSGIILGNLVNLLSMFWREDKGINLFRTPIGFAFGILLLAIVVGLVTGLYPSMRAKKVSALNALRYE